MIAGPVEPSVVNPSQLVVHVDPIWVEVLLSGWMRIAAFVWGTLWGSFANVVIWRLPQEGLSIIKPGSHCGSCGKPVAWYDNIPVVSYLILRGRCRHCETQFGIRYLVVELLAGVLSFALYMRFVVTPMISGGGMDGLWAWLAWFVFCVALLIVTYTDLDVWIIPDEVVLPLGAIGMLMAWLVPEVLGVEIIDSVVAAGLGFGLIWLVRWVYLKWRNIEAMGLGDGKLLFMVGAFCGPTGLAWTLGAGALQGLLVSIPMMMLGKDVANTDLHEVHGDDPELAEDPDGGVMGRRVPFGPFLALAALEFVLLRPQIDNLIAWMTGIPT